MLNKVERTSDFPPGKFSLWTYADLDAGRLPAGCWYYVQLSNGERYRSGSVLVVEVTE